MHILQRIAVEAENTDEAKSIVIEYIEDSGEFSWSDWSVVGGRWGEEDVILNYSETPEKFLEALEQSKTWRIAEVKDYLQQVDVEHVMSLLKNYNGERIAFNEQDGMQVWKLHKALEIASGYSNPFSYFYDITGGGTGDKYVQERIETNPTEQYLIAVDFHF